MPSVNVAITAKADATHNTHPERRERWRKNDTEERSASITKASAKNQTSVAPRLSCR